MFNIRESISHAEKRLLKTPANPSRAVRSDEGTSRLHASIRLILEEFLCDYDRPSMKEIFEAISTGCQKRKIPIPSRSTIYKYFEQAPGTLYSIKKLPTYIQSLLYNLDLNQPIRGRHLAFYCFNYGNLKAISFAAGLPWLDLYQAARLTGYRPKSRGLIGAVMKVRGI